MSVEKALRYEAESDAFMEKYIETPSTSERIALAEEFFKTEVVSDTFLAFYSTLTPERVEAYSVMQTEIAQKTSRSTSEQIEAGVEIPKLKLHPFVWDIRNFYTTVRYFKTVDPESLPQGTDPKQITDEAWEDVIIGFNLDPRKIPEILVEPLSWMRGKIEAGEVLLLDSSLYPDTDLQKKMLGWSKSTESVLGLLNNKRLGVGGPNILVINSNSISPQISRANLLLGLSHEWGHDKLADYRETHPSSLGENENVFNEFVSMMEEQRLYSLLKKSGYNEGLPDLSTSFEVSEDERGTATEAMIPYSDQDITYAHSQTAAIIWRAYSHTVDVESKRERRRHFFDGLKEGGDLLELLHEVENMKPVTVQVFGRDEIRWEKIK
ncbi:hypothetical protein A2716_03050 [candidate division WWE3 bacterium RIFCSPHIGHO2_01_FULL_40_23]|uniref:Uncharacterized protein n=1 Tax=candidate division WWE3 bacterium RIFCSPLOWO2_01_FULL_41_18 TaxID=1802625 RepID=A0A1F4VCG1_UNCKA|nr:MAG: hypothetical protein A2716_03050 [candidate division WWE3 bacterium RIFCSPHIGHO2_01_FULL_40_23]OGC54807.1 MAG: hypothetical protein A3A78_05005 [candidate division WWE3 bacterium RIFCSPLOWO2_01_FULL_41_18]